MEQACGADGCAARAPAGLIRFAKPSGDGDPAAADCLDFHPMADEILRNRCARSSAVSSSAKGFIMKRVAFLCLSLGAMSSVAGDRATHKGTAAPASARPREQWMALGNFDITSGRAVVSDPCYQKSTALDATLEGLVESDKESSIAGVLPAKNGKWSAAVRISDEQEMGKRVAELLVLHESTKVETLTWRDAGFIVAVDSGTAGVFDDPHFRDDSVLPRKKPSGPRSAPKLEAGEAWYEAYVVGRKEDAQIVPFGVVSSSGFGDGAYRALVSREASGKIDGIRIIFIGDGEEGDTLRAVVRKVFARPSP